MFLGVLAVSVIPVGDLLHIQSKIPLNDFKLFNPGHIIDISSLIRTTCGLFCIHIIHVKI